MDKNHCGFIVQVKTLNKHPNADKLQLAEFFGSKVVVGLDVKVGDIGVYFPEGIQLSEEFAIKNDLIRRPDGKGYLENNRRVKAIRLRGVVSDGLYLPLGCFDYLGLAEGDFKVGDVITSINGHLIAQKYEPPRPRKPRVPKSRRLKFKKKEKKILFFKEHVNTNQLAYYANDFVEGDMYQITLKLHGTSQRSGYLPARQSRFGKLILKLFPNFLPTRYKYIHGTRRTIMQDNQIEFYDDNFRKTHAKKFEGKLNPGETVYYEIVGYQENGKPIMGSQDNRKLQDKEFIEKFGETTEFSYGCARGESEAYIYRITKTDQKGNVIEYSPAQIKTRCDEMGMNYVPEIKSGVIGKDENILDIVSPIVETLNNSFDPIGKVHIPEGVVVRRLNTPDFKVYKMKCDNFKILEGIMSLPEDTANPEDDVWTEI